METRYTKIDAETPKKRGPDKRADSKTKATVCLRPADWAYLRQWQSENDKETNYSGAIERLIERCRDLAPGGPDVRKPRGENGWFLPDNGTSRNAQTRERRRLKREAEKREAEKREAEKRERERVEG